MAALPEQAPPDVAELDAAPPAPKSRRRRLLIGLAAGLPALAVVGGGAAWWVLREPAAPESSAAEPEAAKADAKKQIVKDKKDKKKTEPKADPIYLPLSPALVVNLNDEEALRYLQLDAEVMSRDPQVIDRLKDNMPAVRNNLLLLLGSKRYHDLLTRADKEKLQQEMLAEIRKVIDDDPKAPKLEALFFTNFVTQ